MPFVNVKLIEGVFTPGQKQQIVRDLTEAMVAIEGENMRPVTATSPHPHSACGSTPAGSANGCTSPADRRCGCGPGTANGSRAAGRRPQNSPLTPSSCSVPSAAGAASIRSGRWPGTATRNPTSTCLPPTRCPGRH